MRVGRSARRGEGIRELAHRCEAPMRGGKMRRVLTWPWALGKSDRGLDVLLDRSEGAGITQRAGVGHWDGGAAERADGVPAGAAAAVGARAWAVARGRGPAMPQFIRVTFAVGCLSLVCLLALSSRISDGGGGAVGLLRGRDVGARARGGDPSQGWAASGILSNLRSRRGGIDGGDDLLETAGRHWDQRLARIGAVDSFVEVMRAGTGVRLDMALNVSLWEDSGVVYNDPRRPRGRYARGRGTGGDGGGQLEEEIDGSDMEAAGAFTTTTYKPPSVPAAISSAGGLLLDRSGAAARCPTGHIRVMIAVVSRCCGSLAFTNRDAIRKTWMAGVNSEYPDYMDARFFVAQPPNPKQYTESYNALRGEIKMYNDIVVLPGKEDYLELPRKSLQVLQYAVESPCNYTHVLKIDDDCYLRGDNLMKMIGEGHKQKDGIPSEVPWMHEMYAGQLQGAWEGEWMGFYPDRNPKSK
ncbi:unnamed protein product [Ostreobium quekettii]|uniref:Hexosyltransferase n=1 Tax=Ostreobium quekettii TaxID=121088 RepID=A0A8S1J0C3_9CHLO|nr:unnamed protein product [Ostreobium quekettii]